MKEQDILENERQKEYIEKACRLTSEFAGKLGRIPTACVVTFGCQMNARDSEKLSGVLRYAGFELTEDEDCDLLIYNTCTVRDNADNRLLGRLGSAGAIKKKKPGMKIALCGCMMQQTGIPGKIKETYPFVDLIFGTHNIFRFPEYLCGILEDTKICEIWEKTDTIAEDLPSERKYPFKSGVNIMYGCNNFCTYCIVPYVRGRERSRNSGDIIGEIRGLADDGVIEVMLLGQNVNSYGKGLDEETDFADLLKRVEEIEGIKRIRFMTSHPKDLSDKLIGVMKDSDKICRHLHLPLQSGSDRVLKRMNRVYDRSKYIDLALRIREEIPDIAITTDIMLGFPGETESDTDDTIDVIKKVGFDNAFTFIYSKRTGTPAADMPDQVSEEWVKHEFDRVLEAVKISAQERAALLKGKVMDALVEDVYTQRPGMVSGRLSNNMIVHFDGRPSDYGRIVPVSLDECKGFYYIGSRK